MFIVSYYNIFKISLRLSDRNINQSAKIFSGLLFENYTKRDENIYRCISTMSCLIVEVIKNQKVSIVFYPKQSRLRAFDHRADKDLDSISSPHTRVAKWINKKRKKNDHGTPAIDRSITTTRLTLRLKLTSGGGAASSRDRDSFGGLFEAATVASP